MNYVGWMMGEYVCVSGDKDEKEDVQTELRCFTRVLCEAGFGRA